MSQLRIRTLSTAIFFALAGSSAMAASPLVSASVELGGLNFQLIDLDPNDGIAPSFTLTAPGTLTFLDHANSDSQVYLQDNYSWATGSASPLSTTSAISSTGMSSFNSSPSSLKATTKITQSDLLLTTQGPYVDPIGDGTSNVGLSTTYVDNAANSSANLNARNLGEDYFNADTNQWEKHFAGTLSANTALIITGKSTLSLTLDRATLSSLRLNDSSDVVQVLEGSALASATLKLTGGDTSKLSSGYNPYGFGGDFFQTSFETTDSVAYLQAEDVAIGRNGDPITDALIDTKLIKNFSLVAFNTTGSTTDIGMAVDVYSGANWRNSLATTTQVSLPGTPGVPEPSTYALMGLGLVGLSLVARRRQTQA